MVVVAHNLAAMNAQRNLGVARKNKTKAVEKLSSGYKINRAADDAAGLSISEKMRHQIRGLHQAMNNIEDGINFCQVADGALDEVHNILQRIGELSVQAANDVNSDEDRKSIDDEVQQLKGEMSRVFSTTEFNGKLYWVEPYKPIVTGEPNDMMMFLGDTNNDDGFNMKTNGYGGVVINKVRYSWADLGVSFDHNGYFTQSSGDLGLDWNNEKIMWETSPEIGEGEDSYISKESAPQFRRRYEWEAREDGIYINNLKAASVDDVLATKSPERSGGAYYSLSFHGMDISFHAPKEDVDNWNKMSAGINGRTTTASSFDNYSYWDSVGNLVPEDVGDSADVIGEKTVTIGDAWKNKVADRSDYYHLDVLSDGDGDENGDGIVLVDSGILISNNNDQNDHTGMKWEQFSDIGGSDLKEPNNGGYPIIDWGTDYNVAKNGKGEQDITVNSEATYRYTDSTTGIDFTFSPETDEISLENMVKEIKEADVYTTINAPVKSVLQQYRANVDGGMTAATLSFDGVYRNTVDRVGSNTAMSFALHRDTGVSFEAGNVKIGSTNYSCSESATEYKIKYSVGYTDPETGEAKSLDMEQSISKSTLRDAVKNGNGGIYLYFKKELPMTNATTVNNYVYDRESEGWIKDESEKYSIEFGLKLSVGKLYTEPDYESNINNFIAGKQNSDAGAVLKKSICKQLNPSWFETDVDGNITDQIKAGAGSSYNAYSTRPYTEISALYSSTVEAISGGGVTEQTTDTGKRYTLGDGGIVDEKEDAAGNPQSYTYTRPDNGHKYTLKVAYQDDGSIKYYSDDTDTAIIKKDTVDEFGSYITEYAFLKNGTRITTSGTDIDTLGQWRKGAESNYCNKMDEYKSKLDAQYDSIVNLLKTDNLISTYQTTTPTQTIKITDSVQPSKHVTFDVQVMPSKKHMFIQSGANAGEDHELIWNNLNISNIGMGNAKVTTRAEANNTIIRTQRAINYISKERSKFGAYQNRLERTYDANANYSENLEYAESNIRDTDMVKESMELAKHSILEQAGQSVLTQANQQNQGILKLIQS